MTKLYLVMPAYNEAENIGNTVQQWHSTLADCLSDEKDLDWKIVVCDDGSKDETYSILRQMTLSFPHLEVLTKPNSGHGSTLLYLYHYSIANGCDYIFQTDSDGQTDPPEFNLFWENRNTYDFQIGKRAKRQDGFSRILVTRTLRLVVRMTMGVYVEDANTPFRLMRSDKLSKLLPYIPDDFFLSNVALAALAVKKGFIVGWHTITFKPRQGGVNSINMKRIFKIGWKAIGQLHNISRCANKPT